ncbi:MAG: hypothetical protein IPJ88_14340 [Myxococcales bacterium]|nr:MAG: hypothetical protein IPJ88_14340 [Myxococcales bacterium]
MLKSICSALLVIVIVINSGCLVDGGSSFEENQSANTASLSIQLEEAGHSFFHRGDFAVGVLLLIAASAVVWCAGSPPCTTAAEGLLAEFNAGTLTKERAIELLAQLESAPVGVSYVPWQIRDNIIDSTVTYYGAVEELALAPSLCLLSLIV